ncbi:Piwi-domain-containing protein [Fomitiporia mediterranea MF3/22]|uniref:Piwi-domain-containing protein n=1 Tax=Fomitiporia mediterranea (strain MF3/22) TaxID=694068 RepID=UPI0004409B7B|nr:Piwi-domain-containing protein [Fomitiporia mediterranea MF3/22]EJC99706.1 Piwi-domain-containing protein [Fomitiporia mediterranea MF3/22]
MDGPWELRRSEGRRPRPREGVPPINVSYDPNAPARADDSNLNELASFLHSLSTLDKLRNNKPIRCNRKKRGTPISLRANLFKLDYPEDLVLYDYTVRIEPRVRAEDNEMRKTLFFLFEQSEAVAPFIHCIAHDGASRLIAGRALPPNFTTTIVLFEDEGSLQPAVIEKEYIFRLVGPRQLRCADLNRCLREGCCHDSPQPIISAFNLLLASHAAQAGVRTRRHNYAFLPSSFRPLEAPVLLSANLEACKAFSATSITISHSLAINMNQSKSAIYVPYNRLSDAFIALVLQMRNVSNAMAFYNQIKVTTTYLGYRRRHKVKGFGPGSASTTVITVEGVGQVSVEKYFEQEFGILLEHADDLPVVNVGTKEDVFVPAELCNIDPGQFCSGDIPKGETATLATRRVYMRGVDKNKLFTQGLQMFGLDRPDHPIAMFGIKISCDMMRVPARSLPSPRVFYLTGESSIANGRWNTRRIHLSRPAEVTRLSVFVVHNEDLDHDRNGGDIRLRHLIIDFVSKCRSFGMKLDTALPRLHVLTFPHVKLYDTSSSEVLDGIEQKLRTLSDKPKFLLALLPTKALHIHAKVRLLCDLDLGIPCLCVSGPELLNPKGRHRHLTTLAQKLNIKLGGINHMLSEGATQWLKKTMLVGMDVIHPDGKSFKGTPSIAAVVASRDMDFVHYPASLRIQSPCKEIIRDIKQMIIERIEEYRKHTTVLPRRVVVFRGGVSDGQIKAVLDSDVSGIREAFRHFDEDYRPKLTFIICNKSRRIQFYATKDVNASTTQLVKPGTVVDKEVTGIGNFNFYLYSSAVAQDSVRAMRYNVLVDDSRFRADDFQQGIYNLCYLAAPASRSVSLVPPLYWAKRACKRGRLYLQAALHSTEFSEDGTPSEEQIMETAGVLLGKDYCIDTKNSMSYV